MITEERAWMVVRVCPSGSILDSAVGFGGEASLFLTYKAAEEAIFMQANRDEWRIAEVVVQVPTSRRGKEHLLGLRKPNVSARRPVSIAR